MNQSGKRLIALSCIFFSSSQLLFAQEPPQQMARGVVFHDANQNQTRDPDEKGIEGVGVSNGSDIVKTNAEGRYELAVGDDAIIFVIKPSGWATPLSENHLPQFYYVHKPKGSPKDFRFPGVEPTGPLPASVDFPLHRQDEPEHFRAVLFGDPQPRNQKEVDYIAHDVVEELIGTDASFGVTLGDIAFDDLNTFQTLNEAIALIGIPWYNVIGNHDLNLESGNDQLSDETFERVYGPTYYSFDYGKVHFVVVDNVEWFVEKEGERGSYRGGIGKRQIEFIYNDLKSVPQEQMVVLMMHIPITSVHDRKGLFSLIEDRPFCLSISGHTHHHEHKFLKRADGWNGAEPHHHIINVTVSGSWWTGALDERGLPHTTMADGAPNGYSIISFDGEKYSLEFKAAGRDADYQMQIAAPPSVLGKQSEKGLVFANIFNGSENTKVEMRVGKEGEWREMDKVYENDPTLVAIFETEASLADKTWLDMARPKPSTHLWKLSLPDGLDLGTHLIEIKAVDSGTKTYQSQSFSGKRIIRVVEAEK